MKNQNENPVRQAEPAAGHSTKKPYQTPELMVHGRVDTITKVGPCASCVAHLRHH